MAAIDAGFGIVWRLRDADGERREREHPSRRANSPQARVAPSSLVPHALPVRLPNVLLPALARPPAHHHCLSSSFFPRNDATPIRARSGISARQPKVVVPRGKGGHQHRTPGAGRAMGSVHARPSARLSSLSYLTLYFTTEDYTA